MGRERRQRAVVVQAEFVQMREGREIWEAGRGELVMRGRDLFEGGEGGEGFREGGERVVRNDCEAYGPSISTPPTCFRRAEEAVSCAPRVFKSGNLATCSSLVSELCERTSALRDLSDAMQRGVSVKLQWLAFRTAERAISVLLQKGENCDAPKRVDKVSTPSHAPGPDKSLPDTLSHVREPATCLTNEMDVKPQLVKFSFDNAVKSANEGGAVSCCPDKSSC